MGFPCPYWASYYRKEQNAIAKLIPSLNYWHSLDQPNLGSRLIQCLENPPKYSLSRQKDPWNSLGLKKFPIFLPTKRILAFATSAQECRQPGALDDRSALECISVVPPVWRLFNCRVKVYQIVFWVFVNMLWNLSYHHIEM